MFVEIGRLRGDFAQAFACLIYDNATAELVLTWRSNLIPKTEFGRAVALTLTCPLPKTFARLRQTKLNRSIQRPFTQIRAFLQFYSKSWLQRIPNVGHYAGGFLEVDAGFSETFWSPEAGCAS